MRSPMVLLLLAAAACDVDSIDVNGPGGGGRAVEAPAALRSTTLDGGVALTWSDNPFRNAPSLFQFYRVQSASFDLDRNLCGTDWRVEGTTVAPEFVAGSLRNGVPRCFRVRAVSIDGVESGNSPLVDDTPRPDARNVVLYARQVRDAGSGFRFWRDVNADGLAQASELGLLLSGSAADADFSVERDASGALFLAPLRTGTTVTAYGSSPVDDLTGVDSAPETGFLRNAIEAVPGWGYVFETSGGDGFPRYGAVRVTHVGRELIIVDWSFQTDPGNPELLAGRLPGR